MSVAPGLASAMVDGVLHVAVSGSAAGLARREAIAAGVALRESLLAALAPRAGAEPPGALLLTIRGWDWALDEGAGEGPPGGLAAICARIAAGPPAIAAVSGLLSGDGAALMLACGYVVARSEGGPAAARIGFPQAGLGRLPAGGAIGRLAGRLGAGRALECLLGPRPLSARRALALGLVEALSGPDPDEPALALARLVAAGRQDLPPRPGALAQAGPAAWLDAVADARRRLHAPGHAAGPVATPAIIPARAALVGRLADCLEAALLLPPAHAAEFESAAVAAQAEDPAAAALGHLGWAARAAAAALPVPAGRPPQRVAVLGEGDLAADLAGLAIGAGLGCVLVTPEGPALAESLRRIAVAQDAAVAAGQLAPERREADWARLEAGLDPGRAEGCDIVIEAGAGGDPEAARLLGRAAAVARRGAALATVTARDPALLAARTGRFGPCLGFALVPPLHRHRLVEITLPAGDPGAAALAARATLGWLALRLGRVPLTPAAPGVAGRCLARWPAAVAAACAAGQPPSGLRALARRWGWPALAAPLGPEAGEDPGEHGEDGGDWRPILVAVLANEGLRLIEAGVIATPAEADLALTEGGAMPRETGGPMHAADRIGLVPLRDRLRALADIAGPALAPLPVWDELIRAAGRFADLDP